MRFDPQQPFGEVHGMYGVKWEQNGALFSPDGRMVTGPSQPDAIEPVFVSSTTDYDTMHWQKVKTLVEAIGLEWPGNKDDGVKLLREHASA